MDWNKKIEALKEEHLKDCKVKDVEASVSYVREDGLLIRIEVWEQATWEKYFKDS